MEALQSAEQTRILVDCRDGRWRRIPSVALQGFGAQLKAFEHAGMPAECTRLATKD